MIVGGQIFEPLFGKIEMILKVNKECSSWKLFQRMRTFILFASSISFSWAASMTDAFAMWKRGFSVYNPEIFFDVSFLNLGLDMANYVVIFLGLLVVFVVSNLQQNGSVRKMIQKQNLVFRWIIYIALLFAVLILGMYGPGFDASEFIYGQF